MMAAVLGSGYMLTGCGGSSSSGVSGTSGGIPPPPTPSSSAATAPPSGFQFTELVNSGAIVLPSKNVSQMAGAKRPLLTSAQAGGAFEAFTGHVELTNDGTLYFQAQDVNDVIALFKGTLDLQGARPKLSPLLRVMGEGDVLPDGSAIDCIGRGQGNARGQYVTVITQEGCTPSVLSGKPEEGFELVAGMGDTIPGGGGILGGDASNVGIDDKGNIAFVCSYVPDGTENCLVGLAYLSNSDRPSGILFSTQDVIPEGLDSAGDVGLFDLSENGQFVAQTTINGAPDLGGSSDTVGKQALPNAVVVHGTIGEPHANKVVAAGGETTINPLLRSSNRVAEGAAIYGPRITRGGTPVTVLHRDADHLRLYHGTTLVAETGGRSPNGNTIASFAPPVCGGDDRIYFVLICVETAELVMYDGARSRTILSRGDKIGFRTIDGLNFGFTRDQADSADRLVLIAEWDDGTSGILFGAPV